MSDDKIIDDDTYFSNVTYNEITDNSTIVYNACHQIKNNNIDCAYCLIRPPSHHSSKDKFFGFCIVNHTFLTAKYLHDNYKKKVLILDYDVHHGDGTQKLVKQYKGDDITVVSMHCYGVGFFPGTGDTTENDDKVLNIPFTRGREDNEYMCAFENLVKPFIKEKNPDIIIVSNGLTTVIPKLDSF